MLKISAVYLIKKAEIPIHYTTWAPVEQLTHPCYSHLSNKRDVTLTNFEIHPTRLLISQIFPPSTPRLLDLCTCFFQKIPPSTLIPTCTFSDLANFAPPPRLFQSPRFQRDESSLIFRLLLRLEPLYQSIRKALGFAQLTYSGAPPAINLGKD